jgi:PTS system mannose-specific IIA component
MNGSNIEVIAAVNLPMLVKLASVRETSGLEKAVIQAKEAGRKYICVASQVLVNMPFDQVAVRNHDHSEGSVMVSA